MNILGLGTKHRFAEMAVLIGVIGAKMMFAQATGGSPPVITALDGTVSTTNVEPNGSGPTTAITAGAPLGSFVLNVSGTFSGGFNRLDWNNAGTITSIANGSPNFISYAPGAGGTGLLRVSIPASLYSAPGSPNITVVTTGGSDTFATPFLINPPLTAPALASLPAASVGIPYSQPLFNGGTAHYNIIRQDNVNVPPPGLPPLQYQDNTDQANNQIAGTPTTPGTYTFTLLISDGWTFAVGGTPVTQTYTIPVFGAPTTTSLDPNTIGAGSPTFNLGVNGTNFPPGTKVLWTMGGVTTTLSTVVTNINRLDATVSNALVTTPGTAQITVQVPSGGTTSPPLPFTIALPGISSLAPNLKTAGGSQFNLTVNGAGFVLGSRIFFGATQLTTNFVNAGQLNANVPAALIASAGNVNVTVVNPANNVSAPSVFTVRTAPVITQINPTQSTAGLSFVLTVTGNNFQPGDQVFWDNTQLFGVSSSTSASGDILGSLATAGQHAITVRTADGVSSNTVFIQINGLPQITSLAPSHRTQQNSAFTLTINGSNFPTGISGVEARWNGVALGGTTVVNSSVITATVDAGRANGAPGAVPITVFLPDGTLSNSVNFVLDAPRTTTSINPTSRTENNGPFTITVNGTNFLNGDIVLIDSTPLITTFVNGTQLTATVPAAALTAGIHQISVKSPDAPTSNSQTLTVDSKRVITQVLPGPTAPSEGFDIAPLRVLATGILSGDVVLWDGNPVIPTTLSSGELDATIPAALVTAGNHNVQIRTADLALSNIVSYLVTGLPKTTSIVPNHRTFGSSGFTMDVNGSNFLGGMQVFFNNNTVNLSTVFSSSTLLKADVPASLVSGSAVPGSYTVSVRSLDNRFSNVQVFLLLSKPAITSTDIGTRTVGSGGFTLGVFGTAFTNTQVVRWDGNTLPTTYVGSTQLNGSVAASLVTAGAHQITVLTDDGVVSDPFTVTLLQPPSISSINPARRVAANGPVAVTINGTNFQSSPGMTALWDNFNLGPVSYVSEGPSPVQVSVPAGQLTPGTHTIRLVTGDGAVSNGAPFVVDPAPTLVSLNPGSATAGISGLLLTANGTNFPAGSRIVYDGTPLTSTVVNAGMIQTNLSSDLLTAGNHTVSVQTAPSESYSTNSLIFTVNPAPTVTSIDPTSRTETNGPFALTINGTNFTNTIRALWNDVQLDTQFVNSGKVTAIVPASLIVYNAEVLITIGVVTLDGVTSNNVPFTVNRKRRVTSISPLTRTAGNGPLPAIVSDTNATYIPGDTVLWDGNPVSTAFNSATQLTGTISAAQLTPGNHTVTVRSVDLLTSVNSFTLTVLPAPVILSLAPQNPTAGNVPFTLTVNGSGFASGMRVQWDGGDLTTSFVSANVLTADVPAGQLTAITHIVRVQTADLFNSNAVSYEVRPAPTTTSLDPANRTVGFGPFALKVIGTNFISGMTVLFDGNAVPTQFNSPTQLQGTISAAQLTAGSHNVQVRTQDQFTTTPALLFTGDAAPALTNVSPNTRTAANGPVDLTVNGTNFTGSMVVYWDNTPLTTVFEISTQARATVPANLLTTGTHQVTMHAADGYVSNALPVTVTAAPVITSINPTSRTENTAQFALTVNGLNFTNGMEVRWDGALLPTTYNGPTQLTATVAQALLIAGPHNITVRTAPGETPPVNSNTVVFTVNPTPSLTSTVPSTRTTGNGPFGLTINGANFVNGMTVFWDSTALTPSTVVNPNQITTTVAANLITAGAHTITVQTADGATSNSLQFNVNGVPAITQLTPASRTAGNGPFDLVVTGSNFINGMTVYFDGTALQTVFGSATSLTGTLPGALLVAGTHQITVRTADNVNSNSLTFTVFPAPILTNISPTSKTSGSPAFTLTANGQNFVDGYSVVWDNDVNSTTFVNGQQLTTTIDPAQITPGTHTVRVRTPDLVYSNSLTFTVSNTPTVSSVDPPDRTVNNGPYVIKVLGTNYIGTMTVFWDSTQLLTTFVSAIQLNATVAQALITVGTHQVTVHTTDGVVSNFVNVQVYPVPVLTTFNPPNRTAGNGPFLLIVSGNNIRGNETMTWDGVDVPSEDHDAEVRGTISAAQLTAGDHAVRLRTTDGVLSNTLIFHVDGAPAITSLNPDKRTENNTPFTFVVNGANFVSTLTALWDGDETLETTFTDSTHISATRGAPLTAGNHTVRLRTVDGVFSNSATIFINGTPTITSADPSSRTAGHAITNLVLTGTNFAPGMFLRFDNTALASTVVDAQHISAPVDAGLLTPGAHQLTVRTADNITTAPLAFNVDTAPTLTSLDPTSRTEQNGPFTLVITGANFLPGVLARFDNTDLATVRVNATTLNATVEAAALTGLGAHTITVRTADGFVTPAGLTFTVLGRPALTSINPTSRTATNTGFTLTAIGTGFVSGMKLVWTQGTSTVLDTTVGSATQLTANIPASLLTTAGTVTVTIQTSDLAQSNGKPFTILALPVITSLNPPSALAGSPAMGVVATGTGFAEGTTMLFDGAALVTAFVTSTTVGGQLPANLVAIPGNHQITVKSADGVISNAVTFQVVQNLQILTTGLPPTGTSAPYSFTLLGTGGTQPYLWTVTGLPTGLSANPTTGVISGVPIATGNFLVHVVLADSANHSVSADMTMSVTISTGPLQVPPINLPQGVVGEGYNGVIPVSGGAPAYNFTLSAGSLPPGLVLTSDGFIGGRPTTVGRFAFTIRIGDTSVGNIVRDLAIDVVAPPLSITTSSPLQDVPLGGGLNTTFAASGGIPGYTFSASGSLPPGATFTGGTLGGSPAQQGTFGFRVTVVDSLGTTSFKDFTITVTAPALTIGTTSLPIGQLKSTYAGKVEASGGSPPYSFSITGLPLSMSFNADGSIGGVPGTEGKFPITATVTDTAGKTASKTFELAIEGEKLNLTGALADGQLGLAYAGAVSAIGGAKPYTFSFSGLPAGLTGAPDGKVGGLPQAVGGFSVSVTVTDNKGTQASETFPLSITPQELTISTVSLPNGIVGAPYAANVTANGGVPQLTFSATGLPPGISMSVTGSLSGTPTTPGAPVINVTVKDSNGVQATKSFPFSISLPTAPPLTITGLSVSQAPGSQPRARATITAPFPVDIMVTLTMTVAADTPPADPAAQFSTGGRSATLVIPAGSTVSPTDVGVQTGTVAGTITITGRAIAGGIDITPTPAPTTTLRINPAPPVLTGVTATRSGSTITVTISGFSSSKQVSTAVFTFNPAPGSNFQTNTVTLQVDQIFTAWYQSAAAANFGGMFTFSQTFNVTGDPAAIGSVTVTLNSPAGASTPTTVTIQ